MYVQQHPIPFLRQQYHDQSGRVKATHHETELATEDQENVQQSSEAMSWFYPLLYRLHIAFVRRLELIRFHIGDDAATSTSSTVHLMLSL